MSNLKKEPGKIFLNSCLDFFGGGYCFVLFSLVLFFK